MVKKIPCSRSRRRSFSVPDVVTIGAELKFDKGRIIGWTFFSTRKIGTEVLKKMMRGEIPGLEYCKDRPVRPIMGGRANRRFEYSVGFPKR